ncbi:flavin monoamine oxidase family protein [Kitasatospora sp. NPDC059646]|uniref:flavin monoamine oxidase family protein n=1 Tax=Kitasatospora sp. NPDC059646 TaxID=3346893 RepID=UPI0036D1B9D1
MWDVAVVGAGVGGCYLAHRLAGPGTALFEATGRIGGRLRSAALPGLPGVVAEYGATRFDASEHTVTDLLRHLGLAAEAVPFPVGRPENLAHLRGTALRTRDLLAPTAALPYRLRADERGRTADGLTELAAERALPGFAALRAEAGAAGVERYRQARRAARWRGRALHEVPWTAVLDAELSPEAAQLVQDGGGYDQRSAAGSAAHWLDTLAQSPPGAGLRRLRCGFEELPRALHRRFTAAGGTTFLHHRLTGLERTAGGYRLRFDRTAADARAVVLALPQRAAAALLPADGAAFRRGLHSQHPVPAVKLFLTYPGAWWRRAGVARGRSTTDLPNRQLWYWHTPEDDGPAALLAVYADGPAHRPWAGPDPAAPAGRAHASAVRLHGLDGVPAPVAARRQVWPVAWPVWRPGFEADEVIPAMRRPLPGEPVYWVNDAWTPRPGSVEGVLQAAERVLRHDFALPPPPWLRAGATCWDRS